MKPSTRLPNGEVSVTLCGRDIILKPSFRALMAIEKRTGVGPGTIAARISSRDARLEDIVICLHEGALAGPNKDVPTLDEIGDYVVETGILQFLMPVSEMIMPALTVGASKSIPVAKELPVKGEALTQTP